MEEIYSVAYKVESSIASVKKWLCTHYLKMNGEMNEFPILLIKTIEYEIPITITYHGQRP